MRERVARARAVVSVGTAYLALAAALGGWVVALAPARSDLAPWAPLGAARASPRWPLGYQARSVRDRVARFAMLAGAASLTVAGACAVVADHPSWVLRLVVVTALVGRGGHGRRRGRPRRRLPLDPAVAARPTGSSRLAVVLVLPLGVVAAGGIEALRRLTSG